MLSRGLNIHPLLADEIGEEEAALMDIRTALTKFKPKQCALELNIVKSNDQTRLDTFKESL